MCCGGSRGAIVATFDGGFASKLDFAVKKRILARTATSGGLSY